MNALSPALAGTASGVNNAVSRAAGLLAIAVFGAILAQVFDARLAGLSLPADVLREIAAQKAKMAGIQVADPLAQRAVREAFVAGFRAVMLVSAALAALSAAVTALALGRKQADPIPP